MFPAETRFLIIDDTNTIRLMIKETLKKHGYTQMIQAEDGAQAIAMLDEAVEKGQPFQCIICDWNMPNKTGMDVLQYRNESLAYSDCPFLMVTIESERDHVLKAVAMGVSDFVVKPFSESTLISKLKGVWDRQ